MAGESNVGSILGYLKLDRSDWDRELNAAGVKADELARHNPNIKIGTNATSAIAQLSAVAAATKRLQDAQGAEAVAEARLQSLRDRGITDAGRLAAAEEAVTKARRSQAAAVIALAAAQDTEHAAAGRAAQDTEKLGQDADKAAASFKVGLVPALAAIAPAAVPIAGVAGGALLGLLPVAATVALGIKGIEAQMKTAAGTSGQFAQSVGTLKGELATLEGTAAAGLMSGINQALSASQGLFGQVNQDVAVMSAQLGNIVAGAAPALLRILTELNPLFVTFGQLLTSGADALEHWATNSNGVQSFVAYFERELPTVMAFTHNLAVLFGHVVQAAAPIGDTVLRALTAVTGALDAIPVNVLTDLGYAFVALYPVVKLVGIFKAISAAMVPLTTEAVAAKLAFVGVVAATAGLDILGHKLAGALEAGNAYAHTTDNLKSQSQGWTSALIANNGVLDQNTRLQVALALQQNGVAAAGAKVGLSLTQLTDAVTGNQAALDDAFKKLGGNAAVSLTEMAGAFDGDTKSAKAATQAAHDHGAAAIQDASDTQQLAAAVKTATTALQSFYDTELSNAQTQDQFLLGLKQIGQQIGTNGVSLSRNTASGLQNRDMLISLLQSAENAAKGSKDYTGALEGNVTQLEAAAENAGFSKTQVEKLVAEMKLTPKDIETNFNADTDPAMRALVSLQAYIKTHTWDVTVQVNASGQAMGYVPGVGYTQVTHSASGGPVSGSGPQGVDSQPYLLAPGEWVINDRSVDKYGPGFMAALNAGTLALPTVATSSSGGALAGASPALPAYGELVREVRALRGQVAAVEYAVRDSARENAATIGDRFDRTINTSDRRNHILVATGAGKATGLS